MVSKWKPLTLTPINFSLTDGTSIPAPPDSPPETPRTTGQGPLSSHPTPKTGVFPQHENGQAHGDAATEEQTHNSRTSDAASSMLSPASPTQRRPGSVRKFLGLRSLPSSDSLRSDRPGSPATVSSQAPTLSRRKSSSWFGKKKSVGTVPEGVENARPASQNNRTVSQPAPQPPQKKGPPPPALPELKSLGVSADSLSMEADDMFKNIK